MPVFEYGKRPSDIAAQASLVKIKELVMQFKSIADDEPLGLVVSACLTIATNLTMNAERQDILTTLDCIENIKNLLEQKLEEMPQ